LNAQFATQFSFQSQDELGAAEWPTDHGHSPNLLEMVPLIDFLQVAAPLAWCNLAGPSCAIHPVWSLPLADIIRSAGPE